MLIFRKRIVRLSLFLLLVSTIIASFLIFRDPLADLLGDSEALRAWLANSDIGGPFLIIGLLAVAIVMSPIPSAPIALASGALYGHFFGTIYVIIGSGLGAMIAFTLARLLDVDLLKKWFGIEPDKNKLLGSQNTLMGLVFVSRLLPFISFDVMSYMAGLTSLKFWRFALATFAGIIPASFILAHFGSEMIEGDTGVILLTLTFLGVLSLAPMAWKWFKPGRQNPEHL